MTRVGGVTNMGKSPQKPFFLSFRVWLPYQLSDEQGKQCTGGLTSQEKSISSFEGQLCWTSAQICILKLISRHSWFGAHQMGNSWFGAHQMRNSWFGAPNQEFSIWCVGQLEKKHCFCRVLAHFLASSVLCCRLHVCQPDIQNENLS